MKRNLSAMFVKALKVLSLWAMCQLSPLQAQAQVQVFKDDMAERTRACTACHGEQGKAALTESYPGEPVQDGVVIPGCPVGAEHAAEIGYKHGHDGVPVTHLLRKPAGEEVADNRGADDQIHRDAGELVLLPGTERKDFWEIP